MNKSNNRRVQMTKQLIKDSLLELLETKKIQSITVRALCEHADVNRSTFYKYYGSQYDLLKEMEEDLLKTVEKGLDYDDENSNNDYHLNNILKFIKNNMKFCKILLNENTDADFQARLLGLPVIIDKLDIEMRNHRDVEGIYVRKFILYGGYNLVVDWVKDDCTVPTEKIAEIILRITKNIM